MNVIRKSLLGVSSLLFLGWLGAVAWELGVGPGIDLSTSGLLNGVVGQSGALDLGILFLSSRVGQVAAGLLMLAWFAGLRHGGKGLGLWVGLVLAGGTALLVAEGLDHRFTRPGPVVALEGFRALAADTVLSHRAPRQTGFPEEGMAVLAALCVLAALRLGPAALAGLALWVLVGLAIVASGEAWALEVLGGGIVGLLAAAAVQVTGLVDAAAGLPRCVATRWAGHRTRSAPHSTDSMPAGLSQNG